MHEKSTKGLRNESCFAAAGARNHKYKRTPKDSAHERFDIEAVLEARNVRRVAADSGEFVVQNQWTLPLIRVRVEKFTASSTQNGTP